MALGERLGATASQALMTPFAVVVEYARLLVWPARLSPDYSYNQIPLVSSALDARFAGGVAIVAGVHCGVVVLWRRQADRGLRSGIPRADFLGRQQFRHHDRHDLRGTAHVPAQCRLSHRLRRRCGVADRTEADVRRPAYGAAALLCLLGAVRTWTRNPDWKNELALWSAAIAVAPDSARVQSEYGRVLMTLARKRGPSRTDR